jgi:4-alpha-glucanotransferase
VSGAAGAGPEVTEHRPPLERLALRLGILPAYVDQTGSEIRLTSDATRIALLHAMGVDASTDAEARRALEALDERERVRLLPPVRVVPEAIARERAVRVRLPPGWRHAEYACELRAVSGARPEEHEARTTSLATHEGVLEARDGEPVTIALPSLPGLGYYDVRLTLRVRGEERHALERLIVVPPTCVIPAERVFGVIANLYSVRGARSWGVGTLSDLGELAEWSASRGAAFVGVNPLHALRNRGTEISPYAPVSRLYRNPIYLDPEAIPELVESAEGRAMLESAPVRAERARLEREERVAYERVAALGRGLLELAYRIFATRHAGSGDARDAAYRRYLEQEGESLTMFAVFSALEEHFARTGGSIARWREWPAAYRNPRSSHVAAFRESHWSEVDFHRWVQFELDRQLGEAARRGRAAGLSIGLYQDLAIGTAPDGCDTWAYPELFADGVSLGAPPDEYSATGQTWGLPPVSPHRLIEDRYAYWIALLRAALRHAGLLRIDHVLGLFRQFWVPAGRPGTEGAYVRFPASDLLGILALESVRHGAVIVGEDLGTVPPEVPGTLKQWGILGSRVLLFERTADGAFRPAASYENLALATAGTHDTPTLAGFWQGRDIELRREVGMLETDAQVNQALAARARDRQLLLERLAADGALPTPEAPATGAALRGAVHRFLCSTPALLVGLSLDDLAGETEPVNIPGVGPERFSSWTRRMRRPLESLRADPAVEAVLGCDRGRRR